MNMPLTFPRDAAGLPYIHRRPGDGTASWLLMMRHNGESDRRWDESPIQVHVAITAPDGLTEEELRMLNADLNDLEGLLNAELAAIEDAEIAAIKAED